MSNALIIGSNGTLGQALVNELAKDHQVYCLSRNETDFSAPSLRTHCQRLAKHGSFSTIICCIGVLHDNVVKPEKSLQEINSERLLHYFEINSVLPMLCLQHFHSLLNQDSKSVFACLSAMVGSISDNKLGGWYGYRSSKAALNMLIKNTAIEVKRRNKHARIIAIHPGTTVSDLSKPFASNIDPSKYYSPEQSAQRIVAVLGAVQPNQSGLFFNWDGKTIDY